MVDTIYLPDMVSIRGSTFCPVNMAFRLKGVDQCIFSVTLNHPNNPKLNDHLS